MRGYIVERSQGFSGRFLRLTRGPIIDTYLRDVNVHDGYEYEYRVAAENEAGEGMFSKPTGPVSNKDPFGNVELITSICCIVRFYFFQ